MCTLQEYYEKSINAGECDPDFNNDIKVDYFYIAISCAPQHAVKYWFHKLTLFDLLAMRYSSSQSNGKNEQTAFV